MTAIDWLIEQLDAMNVIVKGSNAITAEIF